MSQSPQAALIEPHRLGWGFINNIYSSRFWRQEVQVQGASRFRVCWAHASLPINCCLLTVPAPGGGTRSSGWGGGVSLEGHESHTCGLHPHHLISPQRPHLLRPSHCRLGLQHTHFRGDTKYKTQNIALQEVSRKQ